MLWYRLITDLSWRTIRHKHEHLDKINCHKWCHLSQHRLRLKTTSLKMKKIWGCGVRKKWAYQTSVTRSSSLLKASLAATSITHLNLWLNFWWSSGIVGNVGTKFWRGRRMLGIKKTISLVLLHWFWFCNVKSVEYFFKVKGIVKYGMNW